MQLLWWHWVVAGFVLVLLELIVPTFFLVWFGVAALVTGGVVWLFEPGLAGQLFIWTALSILFTVAWFKYFKHPDRTRAGQSKQQAVGQRGLVTRAITELGRGEILFQSPLLGSDRWEAIADEPIAAGERAVVIDVQAHTLKVARQKISP